MTSALAPTNITIKIGDASPSADIHVAENGDEGRIIGEVLFDNYDPSLSYTFGFVSPADDTQFISTPFEIVAGSGSDAGRFFFKLQGGIALDFEGDPLPDFAIKIVDSQGASAVQSIGVTVDNTVDQITVDGGTVLSLEENSVGGDLGAIEQQGGDPGDYTYELLPGQAENDPDAAALAALFTIENGHLIMTGELDYEHYAAYDGTFGFKIKGQIGSDTSTTFVQSILVDVGNVNEAPTAIHLSNASVAENAAAGTVIGMLTADDADANEHFTFKLLNNDGGAFKIENGKLVVADGSKLDFEAKATHQVKVQVTDSGGLTHDDVFNISLTDVAETTTITGTARNDRLFGTAGADIVNGLAGNDRLYGSGGDDVLNGGLGKDKLFGGAGRDTFVFDTRIKKGFFDQIADFKHGEDTIEINLSAIKPYKIKALKAGELKKKFFKVGNHVDGNDFFHYDKKKGILYLDKDGGGPSHEFAILKLKPGTLLTADDLHFI